MDIIPWLGTTQLIACPDPNTNLSCEFSRDIISISVVCLTADARGWCRREALKSMPAEYLPFDGTSILMMNSGESMRPVKRDIEIMFLNLS